MQAAPTAEIKPTASPSGGITSVLGVATRGDEERARKCQDHARELAAAWEPARDNAGIYHDEHELKALHDGRSAGVGQANRKQIGKRVAKHTEQGEHCHNRQVARVLEQLHKANAVEQQNDDHEHSTSEKLAYAEQPNGVDLVVREQVTCRRTGKAPKDTAEQRGEHPNEQTA